MKKTALTLFVVILMCISITMTVNAAVCANSPDGIHHFNSHQSQHYSTTVNGSHQYEYSTGNGVVQYGTCNTTTYYEYCMYKCSYCGTIDSASGYHNHYLYTTHSVNHN